jgi:hypothetical protein
MGTDDGNLDKLARKNWLLGPRPNDEEPPEVTIRRGRGDSDAELFDYMRQLWADEKAENAHLRAELHKAEERIAKLEERVTILKYSSPYDLSSFEALEHGSRCPICWHPIIGLEDDDGKDIGICCSDCDLELHYREDA